MADSTSYIWYACYGSNLLKDRFHCYIAGGQPKGSTRVYEGCRDKSLPIENHSIELPHALYFSQSAETWHGGGVAFINPEKRPGASTLGRRYLITKDQFAELVKQESQLKEVPTLDYKQAERERQFLLSETAWYNQLIFIGTDQNMPIFTFTHNEVLRSAYNAPHKAYLKTIIRGLKSCFNLSDQEIIAYLSPKPGIEHHYTPLHLKQIIAQTQVSL